jgi:hypothetical protein
VPGASPPLPRNRAARLNARLHPCKQTWFSGAEREMQAEAAPPRAYGRSFAIGRTCSHMLATYRLRQRETSLKTRQVFMAGPDDKQVEARGAVTHNGGGPLPVTRPQKRGRKMHGSMHVSGTYSWKKPGGPEGAPCGG